MRKTIFFFKEKRLICVLKVWDLYVGAGLPSARHSSLNLNEVSSMFSLWVSLIDRIFWIWETKHNIIAIILCSLSPLSPSFAFLSSSSTLSSHCFFVYRISWPGSADTSCGLFKNSGLSAMHYCIDPLNMNIIVIDMIIIIFIFNTAPGKKLEIYIILRSD